MANRPGPIILGAHGPSPATLDTVVLRDPTQGRITSGRETPTLAESNKILQQFIRMLSVDQLDTLRPLDHVSLSALAPMITLLQVNAVPVGQWRMMHLRDVRSKIFGEHGYDWDFAIEECHPREQCIPCHDVLIVKFKEDSPAKSSPRKKRTSNGNTRQKPAAPPACPPCRKKDAPVWLRMSIVPELCFQDKYVDSQKRIVARSSVIFDQMVAPRKALLRALTQADVSDKREVRRFNEALIVYHMRWYLHENRHGDVNLGSKHRPQSYRMDDILARMQPRAAVVADSEDNLRDGLACFESCLSSIDPKPR
ncbi:hypothetical protein SLS57_003148 [Botryosphaeria dothidea]